MQTEKEISKIKFVKSHKAKYLRLTVASDGLRLTVPRFATSLQVNNFLNKHKSWISNNLERVGSIKKVAFVTGEVVSLMGEEYALKRFYMDSNRTHVKISVEEKTIYVFAKESEQSTEIRAAFIASLKKILTKYIAEKVQYYMEPIGVKYQRISLREQRSRWGSCSSKGNLNFNWKIALAPKEVMEYVIVHEVAHLKEHNHSKNYWQIVRELMPGYTYPKDWLKKNAFNLEIL